jgi:sialate O-acetylesterase
MILDLRGEWRIELGDSAHWADPRHDDSRWEAITVPSRWEDEGFPGYDGYAWLRKHFKAESRLLRSAVHIHLGYIDDVSEVFLNGHFIGFTGRFPPNFYAGSAAVRYQYYNVPQEYLRYGEDNVVAVRVFDLHLAGGLVSGRIGLYEPRNYLWPDFLLEGRWKFRTGDDPQWSEPSFDDSRWTDIIVPGFFETQGFKDYDGFAWYRLSFSVPQEIAENRLILLLGKVDDVDEVFLNGTLIGRTGPIPAVREDLDRSEWLLPRAYTIPPGVLKAGENNTLAVRVLDVWMHGGIYDGPVGLVLRENYMNWKNRENPLRRFLDWLW